MLQHACIVRQGRFRVDESPRLLLAVLVLAEEQVQGALKQVVRVVHLRAVDVDEPTSDKDGSVARLNSRTSVSSASLAPMELHPGP